MVQPFPNEQTMETHLPAAITSAVGPITQQQAQQTAVSANPSPIHTKRGSVACKRCRRAKTKCLHQGKPPCRSCSEAGLAAACVFPPKGTSFIDRAPSRKKRPENESGVSGSIDGHKTARQVSSPLGTNRSASDIGSPRDIGQRRSLEDLHKRGRSPSSTSEDLLPPLNLIEEATDVFFVRVNQCAFLHKPTFVNKLRDPSRGVSPLLVLAICALTHRFLPNLIAFCGANRIPPNYFVDRGRSLLFEALGEPNLEACQAAYLLGLSDWGTCKGKRSWMIMGIAVRMAFLLGLHKEETHAVPPNATPDQLVAAEEGRRTFWTLYINDRCVSSGGCRPSSIVASEVTTRLPCDEDSFAFGTLTAAYYLDKFYKPPLTPNGAVVDMGMMAYMVQVAELWGRAARRACSTDILKRDSVPPWEPGSDYARIKSDFARWTNQLPPRQQYSKGNLAVYYQRCLETAFAFNHVVHRAADVILRRPYMPFIVRALAPDSSGLLFNSIDTPWQSVAPPAHFWIQCGKEMFYAAMDLATIIVDFTSMTHYSGLSPHLGFSTFLSAATLTYVWRWPWLCPERAVEVPQLVMRSTDILASMIPTWPMARHWVRILRQPIRKRIEETVQEDMATDQREGIYRQNLSANEGSEHSGEEALDPELQAPRNGPVSNSAPALHTLALAAAESVPTQQQQQQQTMPPHVQPVAPMPMQPPPHMQAPLPPGVGPAPNQDLSLYSLLGPHSEMPFGDPGNPQSFNDVLAFMEGSEQWSYSPAQ